MVSFLDESTSVPSNERLNEIDDAEPVAGSDGEIADHTLNQQISLELQATREDLQSTIEELESANEELKASNEEVMSMNEELQSTNEELETSREELQSLNEELSTVNNQLHDKVEELEATTNDLSNLLTSTDMATLFLDNDLRIRRFTPATTRIMSILDTDVGRPISDLAPRVNDPDLVDDARKVLADLTPIEKEVRNGGEKWFVRRVMPFRTADNKIEGVVVTLSDVTNLKTGAQKLEARERQQAVIAHLGRAALSGEDVQTLCERAAREIADTLQIEFSKVLRLEQESQRLKLVAGVGWKAGLVGEITVPSGIDSQAGYTLHTAGPVIVDDLEKEKRFSGPPLLTDHEVVSGFSVVIGPEESPWGVLGAHSRERREFTIDDAYFLQAVANLLWEAIRGAYADDLLRERERRLTLVTDAIPVLIAYCDKDKVYRFCNSQYEEWFGLKQVQIVGKHLTEVIGQVAYESVRPHVEKALRGERVSFEQLLPYRHGPARNVHIEYVPEIAEGGEVLGYYAMIEDISERMKAEHTRSRLAAIVEHSNDAIVAKDLEGRVMSWNHAAERMYGYTEEEMIGQPMARLCPEGREGEVD
ncbi:MAG: PAS domain-containing protein, partial [Planctomycetaceae bacterium]|nr:PAS domain-containing protein [Planctomycetaceae bacterium]